MPADAPAPVKARRLADKLFLGPEFLTWLYFTLIEHGFEMPALDVGMKADAPPVTFAIGKRAQLAAIDATGARIALVGSGLDDNGEVLQAVRRGALLSSLSLEVAIESRVYGATLRADGGFASVRLPDLFTEPEGEAEPPQDPLAPAKRKKRPKLPLEDVLALRAQCMAELETVVDGLFDCFLRRRLSREWHALDVTNIRRHVSAGLVARNVAAEAT